jgi:hypothetical protein
MSLTRDFRVEDVWALPTPGGPDDLPRLVQWLASRDDPARASAHRAVRALGAIRWKAGELLGWDDPDAGLGFRMPTLRDRLPADLQTAPPGPRFRALAFSPLYLLHDEWAAEIANRSVHGLMHISWVPDGTGGYRGQMAVLEPNGLPGTGYMAVIRPFRHLIAYPLLTRDRSGLAGAQCLSGHRGARSPDRRSLATPAPGHQEEKTMPMLDGSIPEGALPPEAEHKLLARLTDLLLQHGGAGPANQAAPAGLGLRPPPHRPWLTRRRPVRRPGPGVYCAPFFVGPYAVEDDYRRLNARRNQAVLHAAHGRARRHRERELAGGTSRTSPAAGGSAGRTNSRVAACGSTQVTGC